VHASGRIRTCDHRKRAAADPQFGPDRAATGLALVAGTVVNSASFFYGTVRTAVLHLIRRLKPVAFPVEPGAISATLGDAARRYQYITYESLDLNLHVRLRRVVLN
jgi:hypothetical protein